MNVSSSIERAGGRRPPCWFTGLQVLTAIVGLALPQGCGARHDPDAIDPKALEQRRREHEATMQRELGVKPGP